MGGQQDFPVVSVQIHTGQQVQLGVHPVKTPVGQVWEDRKGTKSTEEREKERRKKKREVIPKEKAWGERCMNVMVQQRRDQSSWT